MTKVGIIGCGSSGIIPLRKIIELMSPEIELLDYQKKIIDMAEKYRDTYEAMKSIDLLVSEIPQELSIDQLKKQIKYSKNPLEVKMLNKKLNQMYKDMKRR